MAAPLIGAADTPATADEPDAGGNQHRQQDSSHLSLLS